MPRLPPMTSAVFPSSRGIAPLPACHPISEDWPAAVNRAMGVSANPPAGSTKLRPWTGGSCGTPVEPAALKALATRARLSHYVAVQQPAQNLPGLYDPRNERDSCGMGFVAHVRGERSNAIIAQGLQILANLDHRGGVGA